MYGHVFVDGAQPADTPFPAAGGETSATTSYKNLPIIYVATLQPGSHALDLYVFTITSTCVVFSYDFYAFQLN